MKNTFSARKNEMKLNLWKNKIKINSIYLIVKTPSHFEVNKTYSECIFK